MVLTVVRNLSLFNSASINITLFDAMDIDDDDTDGVMPKGSTWRKIGTL